MISARSSSCASARPSRVPAWILAAVCLGGSSAAAAAGADQAPIPPPEASGGEEGPPPAGDPPWGAAPRQVEVPAASEAGEAAAIDGSRQALVVSGGLGAYNASWLVDGLTTDAAAAFGASPASSATSLLTDSRAPIAGGDIAVAAGGVPLPVLTRSGTNEWRAAARLLFADDALGGSGGGGEAGELAGAGPWNSGGAGGAGGNAQAPFGRGNRIVSARDLGFEAGGPLVEDRLWVWGSWERQASELRTIGDFEESNELDSYALKLRGQPAPGNSLTALFHRRDPSQHVRNVGPTRPPPTAWDRSGGTPVYRLEDTHVFSPSFYLTGSAALVLGEWQLAPRGGREGDNTVSDETFVWRHNYLYFETERSHEQAKLDGGVSFDAARLRHDLKFGVGLRRASVESASTWAGRDGLVGLAAFDSGFARSDRYVENAIDSAHLYLEDTASRGKWTAGAGLRWERQEGRIVAADVPPHPTFPDLFPGGRVAAADLPLDWESIAPRLSVARTLGAGQRTVVRASYARFADQLSTGVVEQVNPGAYRYGYFDWRDDGDGLITPDEAGAFYLFRGFDPARPAEMTSVNAVDPDLAPPLSDELELGVSHAFRRHLVVGLQATYRIVSDILHSDPLVFEGPPGAGPPRVVRFSDFEIFGDLVGTLPDGRSFRKPLYRLLPGLTTRGGSLLRNSAREQEHLTVRLTFDRRLAGGWRFHADISDTEWEWDLPFSAVADPLFLPTGRNEDGATVLTAVRTGAGSRGGVYLSPGWAFSLSGLYEVAPEAPWGFSAAAALSGREGHAAPYWVTVPESEFGDGLGARTVRVTGTTDSFRYDDLVFLDGRLEKAIGLGDWTLTLSLDGFNLLDERPALQRELEVSGVVESSGRQLDSPRGIHVTEVASGRTVRLGARLAFR